jgi:hypothetical protein
LAWLQARHRANARVEDRIRNLKQTGIGRFRSREFGINQTWLQLALTAADLIAWTQTTLLAGRPPRPNPSCCTTGCCMSPPASSADNADQDQNRHRLPWGRQLAQAFHRLARI